MTPTPGRRLVRLAGPLHDRLLVYVLVAAAVGLLVPGLAGRLVPGVPLMLAAQVFGVALTLTGGQLLSVARRPAPVLVALLVQWTLVPLAGLGLSRLTSDPDLRLGILIVAIAPAEITSALVAILAAGSGAVAVSCVGASLAIGTLLTPLWASALLGPTAHVDRGALIVELALAVALPLAAGTALRTTVPRLHTLRPRALDLSALGVILVVFVSVGSARALVLSPAVLPAILLCAGLLAVSYALGLGAAWPWRRRPGLWRALLFPVGMREFGIAAAVAVSVRPSAVAVPGIYGAMLMITAPGLARQFRRSARPGTAG